MHGVQRRYLNHHPSGLLWLVRMYVYPKLLCYTTLCTSRAHGSSQYEHSLVHAVKRFSDCGKLQCPETAIATVAQHVTAHHLLSAYLCISSWVMRGSSLGGVGLILGMTKESTSWTVSCKHGCGRGEGRSTGQVNMEQNSSSRVKAAYQAAAAVAPGA
jgi:hypothetical protein